ncbi:MAG: hypothetical protein O3A46_08060 [Candidatus Poribacteria bacterium]|nr:hypothetical protein [Candidatus Poribacteria bacterium]
MQAWIVRGVCAFIGAALSVALRGHGAVAILPLALAVGVVAL